MSSLPIYLHSGMQSAPTYTSAAGSVISVLDACLVTGFNTQPVSSATASGGTVTFNFPSAPGFSALDTVAIAGSSTSAVNGVFRVLSAASNQVLVSIPGVADGAVGGTITMKFAPLGWDKPFAGTDIAVYRPADTSTTRPFLRLYDPAGSVDGTSRFRAYEAMTGPDTGTDPFPTVTQSASGVAHYKANGATQGGWHLIGDGSVFYFLGEYSGGTYYSFACGDLISYKPADSYRAFLTGGYTGITHGANTGGEHKWVSKSWQGTAGPVLLTNLATIHFAQYPDAASGLVVVTKPVLNYENLSGTVRGEIPGQCWLHCSNGGVSNGVSIVVGVPGIAGRLAVWSDAQGICGFRLDEAWRE